MAEKERKDEKNREHRPVNQGRTSRGTNEHRGTKQKERGGRKKK